MRLILNLVMVTQALIALTTTAYSRENTNFILVHGALFTGDSWAPLQTELAARGIISFALDMPARKGDGIDPKTVTIDNAAQKLCQVVNAQSDKTILVGHSQGGAVINQSLKHCADKISGLIYIAAVAPASGTIAFAALDPERDTNFAKCATANPESGLFVLNTAGPLAKSFFQEIADTKKGSAAVRSMTSEPMGIGTTVLDYPKEVYVKLPKLYILASKDRIVTPQTQEKIVSEIPNVEVNHVNSGHSPQLTHTKKVASLLEMFSRKIDK